MSLSLYILFLVCSRKHKGFTSCLSSFISLSQHGSFGTEDGKDSARKELSGIGFKFAGYEASGFAGNESGGDRNGLVAMGKPQN